MVIPTAEEITRFVAESNKIEGIFETDDHPLVKNHIFAVEFTVALAPGGYVPTPRAIHEIILASEPRKNPGQYRTRNARVGRNTTPRAELLDPLMSELLDSMGKGPGEDEDLEEWIWNIHYEFECIHPFVDGNGRTGRIWMNAIRLVHGLPWLTILALEKKDYFHGINLFRWESKRYHEYSGEDPIYDQYADVETHCETLVLDPNAASKN